MAKEAPSADLVARLYNLALSIDYDQPTSLEGDLDFLAEGLLESEFCSKDYEPTAKDGYLGEVLRAMPGYQEKLADAIEACESIDEILGRMEYGQLDKEDAGLLEDLLQTLIDEMEDFLNEVV